MEQGGVHAGAAGQEFQTIEIAVCCRITELLRLFDGGADRLGGVVIHVILMAGKILVGVELDEGVAAAECHLCRDREQEQRIRHAAAQQFA